MTRPSATCEVFLDGSRVPDTGPQLVSLDPTALDGLKLIWGRDGPNEQPGPATCSFTITDPEADQSFLDVLHVGTGVEVWAQGEIDTGESGYGPNTFYNGSFTGWADGDPPTNTYGTTDAYLQVEDESLKAAYGDEGSTSYQVVLFPLPVVDSGELPSAWDAIPRAEVGQTWRVRWSMRAQASTQVGVSLWGITSPFGQDWRLFSIGQTTASNEWNRWPDWRTFQRDIKITSKPSDVTTQFWVAVGFTVRGRSSPRWQDQGTRVWEADARTWDDQTLDPWLWLDDLILQPPAQTTRRVLSFSGSVTDVVASPDGAGGLDLAVTAADLGSDLGNRVVGDDPWPVQSLATRADRIALLGGITTTPRVRIDEPLGALQVSYRDVDAQPAYGLLQDLAQTGGGVLWAATHAVTGPYLWIENPAQRVSLAELDLSGGLIVITGRTEGVTLVSACDLLEEPVQWIQDTGDVSTVVAVTWLEQGTDDEGQITTTDRTETITDTDAVEIYGTRRLSISTELIAAGDARNLAAQALATARAVGWRIEGLTWDTDAPEEEIPTLSDTAREIALLDLLDGTGRMGLGVTLIDLPAYTPRGAVVSVYVEGGTYTFTGGAWTLDLTTTPAVGYGSSALWGELNAAWTWGQWSPSVVWQDLYGVAA